MNTPSDIHDRRNPADTELKFFGAITASVTHELNNVLAIIDQVGGLLEDLIIGAEQGETITSDQLKRIAEKINAQTQRGLNIIKRLNSFSHSIDETITTFDICELMFGLVALAQRFAGIARVSLTVDTGPSDPVMILNNPLKVQQIVFLVLREIFGLADRKNKDSVTLAIKPNDAGAIIIAKSTMGNESAEFVSAPIEKIASEINGAVNTFAENGTLVVKIEVPSLMIDRQDKIGK
jgi:C4-dicarboxylate-specific signal transduction histidine kinase